MPYPSSRRQYYILYLVIEKTRKPFNTNEKMSFLRPVTGRPFERSSRQTYETKLVFPFRSLLHVQTKYLAVQ